MKDLLMEEEFRKSANYKEYLSSIDKIEHHVERARKITHSMLGFVRKMEPRPPADPTRGSGCGPLPFKSRHNTRYGDVCGFSPTPEFSTLETHCLQRK